MTHSTVKVVAMVGAALVGLSAWAPPAHARWLPYWGPVAWAPWVQVPPPPPYLVYYPGPDQDPYPPIYLNGWSTSCDPHDCNRGCINSNGG